MTQFVITTTEYWFTEVTYVLEEEDVAEALRRIADREAAVFNHHGLPDLGQDRLSYVHSIKPAIDWADIVRRLNQILHEKTPAGPVITEDFLHFAAGCRVVEIEEWIEDMADQTIEELTRI